LETVAADKELTTFRTADMAAVVAKLDKLQLHQQQELGVDLVAVVAVDQMQHLAQAEQ
jgi:hypothetical protein